MKNKEYDQKIVTCFYKYVEIGNPIEFQEKHLKFCNSLGLKGRIMVGKEGINGGIYGTREQINKYKEEITKNPLFSDMEFKDQVTYKRAYRKMFVRLRKEIVAFETEVELKNTADYVSPKEFKNILDNKEDVVLLDMRNDYEFLVGKFKNARTISMQNFRELPEKLNEIEDLKDKRIITYCTGGIRCEKGSAFLKQNGFKYVSQLKGGILSYVKQFPDTYWDGKCYVFDDRLAVPLNNKHEPISNCPWCNIMSDNILNCHNLNCNKQFTCCEECVEKHNKSCCEECEKSINRRKDMRIVI